MVTCSHLALVHYFKQKIKRTQLIAKRWLAATDATPTDESPESSGWVLDETDGFKILWFEGNATPDTIDMVTTTRIPRFKKTLRFNSNTQPSVKIKTRKFRFTLLYSMKPR